MKLHFSRRGKGPPLLLLHGLFGSSNNWAPLARALEGKFDLISPDLRNHGRSPHDSDASLEAMAADLGPFLDGLGLPSAFVLGHSLGGRVAMRLALDQAPRVGRLLVADMAPRAYGALGAFEALEALDLASIPGRNEAEEALASHVPDAGMRAFLLTNLSRDAEGKFKWRMNLPALRAQRASLSAQISSPGIYDGEALFLKAENSGCVRDEDLAGILALFPRAKIRTLEGAGHWLHVDRPSEFASEVAAFFGD